MLSLEKGDFEGLEDIFSPNVQEGFENLSNTIIVVEYYIVILYHDV